MPMDYSNLTSQSMDDPTTHATHVTAGKAFYAPKPRRWTVFMRTLIPWQLVRFVWINFKMIDMIRVSHGGRR
jgi:hypothetical protein